MRFNNILFVNYGNVLFNELSNANILYAVFIPLCVKLKIFQKDFASKQICFKLQSKLFQGCDNKPNIHLFR